jgi:hypothetical protein
MALERRTLLTVRRSLKPRPNFLMNTFRHPAQVSPCQASTNKSLQRTTPATPSFQKVATGGAPLNSIR